MITDDTTNNTSHVMLLIPVILLINSTGDTTNITANMINTDATNNTRDTICLSLSAWTNTTTPDTIHPAVLDTTTLTTKFTTEVFSTASDTTNNTDGA